MAQQPVEKLTGQAACEDPREIEVWKGKFEPLLKQIVEGVPPSLVVGVDGGDYEETHALIER